jgi:hypothetical protein
MDTEAEIFPLRARMFEYCTLHVQWRISAEGSSGTCESGWFRFAPDPDLLGWLVMAEVRSEFIGVTRVALLVLRRNQGTRLCRECAASVG